MPGQLRKVPTLPPSAAYAGVHEPKCVLLLVVLMRMSTKQDHLHTSCEQLGTHSSLTIRTIVTGSKRQCSCGLFIQAAFVHALFQAHMDLQALNGAYLELGLKGVNTLLKLLAVLPLLQSRLLAQQAAMPGHALVFIDCWRHPSISLLVSNTTRKGPKLSKCWSGRREGSRGNGPKEN